MSIEELSRSVISEINFFLNSIENRINSSTEQFTFKLGREDILEIKNKINLARDAVLSGDENEVINALEGLLEDAYRIKRLNIAAIEKIIDRAYLINPNRIEVLFEPRETKLIIPNIIIAANDDLLKEINRNQDLLYSISSRKFEEIIADIFSRQGFIVELMTKTRDGGRDIVALYSKLDFLTKIIIECKKYAKSNKVGIQYVQRIFGVKIAEQANKALLVTTSTFTKDALRFEKEHFWDLELKDYKTVLKWIKEYNEMIFRKNIE